MNSNSIQNMFPRDSNSLRGNDRPGKVINSVEEVTVSDRVDVSSTPSDEEASRPKSRGKISRRARKAFATTAGIINGAVTATHNISLGMKIGYNQAVKPGKDISQRKKELSKLSIINRTITGAVAGSVIWGPVGLVLGGMTGYVSASLKSFMDNKSGGMDNLIKAVDSRVARQMDKLPRKQESSTLRKVINSVYAGGIAGMKEGWTRGKQIGQGSGAGLLSGAQFILQDIRENNSPGNSNGPVLKDSSDRGIITKTLIRSVGVVSGISGILMNAPGGIVEGSLHSVEMGENRREITRPLLLFATNAGKIFPPALVGAAIGGPLGAAVGTAVGLVSGSLSTIIDGRYGFNRGITRKVQNAVNEVVDEDITRKGNSIYHNSAKGSLVGAYAGIKEGWRLGYRGGVEFMDNIFEIPTEAAKHKEPQE